MASGHGRIGQSFVDVFPQSYMCHLAVDLKEQQMYYFSLCVAVIELKYNVVLIRLWVPWKPLLSESSTFIQKLSHCLTGYWFCLERVVHE